MQETKRVSSISSGDVAAVFSATPPLEAIRLVLSLCMTVRLGIGNDRVLSFLDISRAHPHCDVLRENLYVDFPPESGVPPGYCGLLKRSLYGLRDAPQAFEKKVRELLEAIGFVRGVYSPCVFVHHTKHLIYVVHGDDFIGLGSRVRLGWASS